MRIGIREINSLEYALKKLNLFYIINEKNDVLYGTKINCHLKDFLGKHGNVELFY